MKQLAKRPQPNNDLSIILADGSTYQLNEYWAISDSGNYEFRLKSEDKAFVHGGYALGDGKVKSRTISLEFSKRGATEQDFDEAMNLVYTYLSKTNYTLTCGRTDRCYKVNGLSKVKSKYNKGFKNRWAEVTATLVLADVPFRLATAKTTVVEEYTEATEETISITNTGSVESPLVITVIPAEGETVSNFILTHEQSGESCRMADALLTAPAEAVISGEQGTVRRGADNSINTFSGIFLHIGAGVNSYTVTVNGACTVKIEFTPRYFV